MTTRKTRRGLGLLAAFAIAAGGFAIPASALAADPNPQVPSVVDLNAATTGQLTIHKREKADDNGTTAGNGLEDTAANAMTPVKGVTYKIQRVNGLDLRTQAGWAKLADFKNSVDALTADTTLSLVDAKEKTTEASGDITFENLALGAYVVTETAVPAGYTASAPFLVTVPMTDPTDPTKWNYAPHVYPKNPKTEIAKTVEDSNALAVGSTLSYTLESDIPNLPAGQTLKFFQVVDQYDARLTLDKASIALKVGPDALTATTDYELKYIDTEFDSNGAKVKRVTAVFTEAGRKKILDERRKNNDVKVVMTLNTTLAKPIGADGTVENTALVIPNEPADTWDPEDPNTPPPPDTPESKVESKYGKVKISKADPAGNPLQGAEFKVFTCTGPTVGTDPFTAGDWTLDPKTPIEISTVEADGTVKKTSTFTTAADGTVTIDGLQNNDWEDGKAIDDAAQWDWYCLVETKAPEGFELQTKPMAFQITRANSTLDKQYQLDAKVTNVPKNGGFELPLTGAAGVGVLITAGALLAAGSGVLAYANKRRRDQEA